jgi:ABC-type polysaccharide/polyol phosphate export permease
VAANVPSAKQRSSSTVASAFASFYHQRWLLKYFIQRQVTRAYKTTYLGFIWAILGPLIWVFFLSLIFSQVIGIRVRIVEGDPTLNFGLFLYCGLLPFLVFSEAVSKGLNSIRSSSGLVKRVIFPIELLPFTNVMTSMIDKFFGIGALLVVVLAFGRTLHWTLLLLPLVIVVQLIFILGLTYLMAILGTYAPDLGEVTRPLVRGMFFFTPILWPPERLPEDLRWVQDYNPLAYLVEAYRGLILYGELPGPWATLYFTLFSVALLVFAFALFVRTKHNFADLL